MRGSFRVQGIQDNVEDPLHIAEHIIVPEPQHLVAALSQPFVSNCVSLVRCMLAAVDFNNQSSLPANEVDDKWSNWVLADEFETAQ